MTAAGQQRTSGMLRRHEVQSALLKEAAMSAQATSIYLRGAPRGTTLNCKGWQQEGALRMLLNNLDPEVAERPQELVVYGGAGKAARNWPSLEAIVRTLQGLG